MNQIKLIATEVRHNPTAMLSELVIAWGAHKDTDHPVYIEELPRSQSGLHCDCVCPACRAPLVARNAGVPITQRRRRAHFAHSAGTATRDCQIVAARLAALRALSDQGYIELPGYKVRASARGLSGTEYTAEHTVPPRSFRLQDIQYQDATTAILTLDDGRRLRVEMVGSLEAPDTAAPDDPDALVPTIRIIVNDPEIADLSPEELLPRLTLSAEDTSCWRNHWEEEELRRQAELEAQQQALDALDALPHQLAELEALPPELRRQGLLHALALQLLQEAGHIAVPSLRTASASSSPVVPSHLDIEHARAEPRLGQLIPDLILQCRQPGYEQLLCEVTVTHGINPDKLTRLRALELPAIELDFRLASGKISRAELRHLVVEDTHLKRWVCHPSLQHEELASAQPEYKIERSTPPFTSDVASDSLPSGLAERRVPSPIFTIVHPDHVVIPTGSIIKRQWAEMSDDQLRSIYLSHIRRYGVTDTPEQQDQDINSYALHVGAARELVRRGFTELTDPLLSGPAGLIEQLISIRYDKVIGAWSYSPRTAAELVIFMAARDDEQWRPYSTLRLLARKVFKPLETPTQTARIVEWRNQVIAAIQAGDPQYLRPRTFDKAIAFLIPDLGPELLHSFGRADV